MQYPISQKEENELHHYCSGWVMWMLTGQIWKRSPQIQQAIERYMKWWGTISHLKNAKETLPIASPCLTNPKGKTPYQQTISNWRPLLQVTIENANYVWGFATIHNQSYVPFILVHI